ncbi:PSD1 and planctomycete cytochrome C domain-containing protein [Prosthecobacter sp. SYSU 5D2]|uniref:PSD1 and planctomycete cytochrome C domain-containing protein n=1 Tax=Prosthecobacter sp. SYSU 5D2 TaxID=3134134 RepID=UPI0031FE4B52
MPASIRHVLWVALACSLGTAGAAEMTAERRAFFEARIRPVLVKQCYECHSAGARKIGGKLLLDSPGDMLEGGESGTAMVPGDPDESLIIQALKYEGIEMPPDKPLSEGVVQDFITWVKMGAPDPREERPRQTDRMTVHDPDSIWAYQPVKDHAVPKVKNSTWQRDPLDAFILQKIEAAGQHPARDASATTLVRRVFIDLTGLPPTAKEVDDFVSATNQESNHATNPSKAYEKLVDRLLQSPHFGERWGRHWLDVARFGESNGNDGLSRNPSFPHAWRYRDYVIQSFNEDTPYDRFITEQIAGDLIPAGSPALRDRQLIATGFLALGAKPAKAMNENFEMDVVADQIGVVGHGIMGLSVACARCHDHKTDPISARDYYAMAGIFKSTETLWGAAAMQGLTAPQTALHELRASPPAKPRAEIEPVILANKPRRTPAKVVHTYKNSDSLAMGVREAKKIEDCKLNIDGESKRLGASVPRGFLTTLGSLDVAIPPTGQQSGRLELAQWLTHPKHPQTARVMVNRLWLHLFGEGLVRTPDDFGVYGERPTHPELLDHLATRFIKQGWSMKRMIRDLVLSRTYQQDSTCDEALVKADPDNLLQARHNRRRLDAEALRDAILKASGSLDARPGQGSLIQARDVLINELDHLHQPSPHRSVYLLMLRNSMPPELTPFNLPDGTAVTGRRDVSTLPTQSLYLLNNRFLVEQSEQFSKRLMLKDGDNHDQRIHTAYRLALGRGPTTAEKERAAEFIRETDLHLVSTVEGEAERSHLVWAAFAQALLASSEMRYVD